MGVTNSNKTISPNQIACDGSLLVTLSLTAAPDIITDPTDIVLTLDRSSSMQGDPLANLKLGAKTFIDIIADATGGTASGQIGYGSRIGIVKQEQEPEVAADRYRQQNVCHAACVIHILPFLVRILNYNFGHKGSLSHPRTGPD